MANKNTDDEIKRLQRKVQELEYNERIRQQEARRQAREDERRVHEAYIKSLPPKQREVIRLKEKQAAEQSDKKLKVCAILACIVMAVIMRIVVICVIINIFF